MDEELRKSALEYHRLPKPGKISVEATKGLINQRDLALAYSPGVAAACEAIVDNPGEVRTLTARGNLVAVITNGTAVLGLGPIGPLAAKPVMEGKGVLFKKFAGIDVFDIEINERDPDKLIDMIVALEPTFGGINLEDIKAPECFYIERKVRERVKIPVFHDDQHGTAIISGAAVVNGLKVVGKDIGMVKLVCSGAGASATACLDMMVTLGLKRENIYVCDSKGVIYVGRDAAMEPSKARYAQKTEARTLMDVIPGADVFLGCSTAGVLTGEMVKRMAPKPLILALANPVPEILPEVAKEARPDCVIATGRSDYPNQVNNVLCFPFLFRGALDVGATAINEEMKLAAVRALAELAQAEQSDVVAQAYGFGEHAPQFGPEHLIPKPFDPRLLVELASAVAKAAMDSGVATLPLADMEAYREQLSQFVYQSGLMMKPVFASAKAAASRRVAYAEGEDERILRAVQVVVDEGLARPILIGRPEIIKRSIQRLGLRLLERRDFEICNQDNDPRFRDYWHQYFEMMQRKGVSQDYAKLEVRRRRTLIGGIMVQRGEADSMLCGTFGTVELHLDYIANVIGLRPGAKQFATMNMLLLPKRTVFIADTYINYDPTAEQLVEITLMAAEEVRRFGLTPKVALLSHSSFGSYSTPSALKMKRARELLEQRVPALEVEGEMHGDAALSESVRLAVFPNSRLKGEANLLIMPNVDAANIAFNLLKTACGDGITIGPILLGAAKPVHILTPTASVRRIVNMTALAVVAANSQRQGALI
jgi:malate dehydrogenase (oxaloacetate-decarboxylating)(NADP+)